MAESNERMYDLIEDLNVMYDEAIPIFPGKIVLSQKELYKIIQALPESLSDEIQDARRIINKKDEIIQEAKLRAERIVQDAENERYKLLNESSLNKAMEEHAEKFRQTVFDECQQIKMQAFNEAQELRLNSKNEAIAMKEESQKYAQNMLGQLEEILNRLYQAVMNGQQKLQDMRSSDSIQQFSSDPNNK